MLNITDERQHKPGRKILGYFCTLDTGEIIFLVQRKHGDIYTSGKASLNEAIAARCACWVLDETTLYSLKTKGIKRVGFREIDTKDVYLTDVSLFLSRSKEIVSTHPFASTTSRKRALPLEHFEAIKCPVEMKLKIRRKKK